VPGPEQFIRSNTPEQRPPSSICGAIPMNEEQLKARLTKQLEFYFSRLVFLKFYYKVFFFYYLTSRVFCTLMIENFLNIKWVGVLPYY